jgi:hypothetical protein
MIRLKLFTGIIKAWQFVTQGKCKYYDVCELSRPDSQSCTKDRGQFYGFGQYPGCYRNLEKLRGKG